jgi:hypothetical protein
MDECRLQNLPALLQPHLMSSVQSDVHFIAVSFSCDHSSLHVVDKGHCSSMKFKLPAARRKSKTVSHSVDLGRFCTKNAPWTH